MRRMLTIGLHAAYWGMYGLLIFLFMALGSRNIHLSLRAIFFPGVFFIVPALVSFYTFYFPLFSRLLQRKRFVLLGIAAVGVSLASGVVALAIIRLILGPRIQTTLTTDTAGEVLAMAFVAFVNGVLALVIHGFISWYGDIRVKEELRRKNMEMELALLRSQLNPHFLFNTLNNIDVLIEKDAAKASGYLKQLSDLLRFMLYEVKAEKISIGQELQTIERYIDLQKIRTAHPETIQYTVEGPPGQWMVEPLLFLPFVENAFKHAEKRSGNAIRIRFELDGDRIRFDCENRYQRTAPAADVNGGLGNSLMRKRLALLYPGRHTLDVEAGADTYKTTLILTHHAN